VQGRKSRFRSADDVEKLVRLSWQPGLHKFLITDDNFARNRDWEVILDRLNVDAARPSAKEAAPAPLREERARPICRLDGIGGVSYQGRGQSLCGPAKEG
jgi:hypothetical protein